MMRHWLSVLDGRRWGLCFVLALLLHASLAAGFLQWQRQQPPAGLPPAMAVDMAAFTPAIVVAPPPKPKPPEPIPEPEPEPIPEPPIAQKPPAEIPKPKPKKKPEPRPEPVEPEPERPAPPQDTAASQAVDAPPATISGYTHEAVRVTWESLLSAHLGRHKRYPYQARQRNQQGMPLLRFRVDREGQVLSWSIEKSSGHVLLDRETEALIRRAQPLPKPPAELFAGKDSIELTVPVEFSIRS